MASGPFIQVIVPLRLEWEPYYALEGAFLGQRVNVLFAHKEYVGVVSAVGVVPETATERIQAAYPSDLPPILPQEIAFWKAIANYYLCTVGEVYKAAYPVLKQESEAVKVRSDERVQKRLALLREKLSKARKEETRERYAGEISRLETLLQGEKAFTEPESPVLSPEQGAAVQAVLKAFQAGKTVLLQGRGRSEIYLQLASETLAQGKSVLYLVPEIALSKQLEEEIRRYFPAVKIYNSARSIAQRRVVADAAREGKAELILGTRSALFLPQRNLRLIILDEEQDISYKQDSPAPRYQARESAILLAGIHHAHVLLGSTTPSLESLYNADTGLFAKVELKEYLNDGEKPEIQLINTAAEARKKGLVGSFSLKLLERMHRTLDRGEKVLVICRSKQAIPEIEQEMKPVFGPGLKGIITATPAGAKGQPASAFGLTAVLQADGLLAREDFRCDERAIQVLSQLRERCKAGGAFVIQTWEAAHPVFGQFTRECSPQLLEERRQFGYPPYTRLIHVILKDNNQKRVDYMVRELTVSLQQALPGISILPYQLSIRIMLPRDKALTARKQTLTATIAAFEKERRYLGHIIIDVDPV